MGDDDKKWQDNRAVIAIGSGAAALVFAYNVMFPTLTSSLQNEVASLKANVQEVPKLKARISELEGSLKAAQVRATSAEANNVFSVGNPYPVGLAKVRIGDPSDLVTSSFSADSIDSTTAKSYWRIKTDHGFFSNATYYFDQNAGARRVGQILFHMKNPSPDVLSNKVTEAFGQPTIRGPKPNCAIWKLGDKLFVRAEDSSFLITQTSRDCNPL